MARSNGQRWAGWLPALVCAIALVGAGSQPALAQTTLTVTGQADGPGTCDANGRCTTLRAAITRADTEPGGGDTIVVPAGTFALASTLDVTRSMTIQGAGAERTFVDGGGAVRVFSVGPAATVVMSALAIRNGHVGAGGVGAGIDSDGDLTLNDVAVADSDGGGVRSSGTLRMNRGSVTGNKGGGILALGRGSHLGPVTVSGTRISDNVGGGVVTDGAVTLDRVTLDRNEGSGLIVNPPGTAVVSSSTISGNSAIFGGGVNNAGSVTLTNSVVNGNRAFGLRLPPDPQGRPLGQAGVGGGILNFSGRLTLTNVTVSGNDVVGVAGLGAPEADGGAIFSGGTATLDFVTVAGNSATSVVDQTAGGVAGISGGGGITIHDSIVAGNGVGTRDGEKNCRLPLISAGYNLSDTHDCGLTAVGDQSGVDPALMALADNGGPTFTMALPTASPAVDAADPRCDVPTDQRGVSRPQGPRCDIGAFEVIGGGPPRPVPPAPPVTGLAATGDRGPAGVLLLLAPLLLAGIGLTATRVRRA